MKRSRMTILATVASVLIVGALFVSLAASSWLGNPTRPIELPPELPDAGVSAGLETPRPVEPENEVSAVILDSENVKKVIETLQRPASCQGLVERTTYWEGGSSKSVYSVYMRNGVIKAELLDDGGNVVHHSLTNGLLYYDWEEGSGQSYSGLLGGMSADNIYGIPSYEYLLELNQKDILSAEYVRDNGINYLIVRDREQIYNGAYYISLETGILIKAEFFDHDGALAISFSFSLISESEPDEAHFVIPGDIVILE